jgi:hypothetical protein
MIRTKNDTTVKNSLCPTRGDNKMQGGAELTFDEQKAACLELCGQAFSEIKMDLIHVATKTITKSEGFSTKATVRRRSLSYPVVIVTFIFRLES